MKHLSSLFVAACPYSCSTRGYCGVVMNRRWENASTGREPGDTRSFTRERRVCLLSPVGTVNGMPLLLFLAYYLKKRIKNKIQNRGNELVEIMEKRGECLEYTRKRNI